MKNTNESKSDYWDKIIEKDREIIRAYPGIIHPGMKKRYDLPYGFEWGLVLLGWEKVNHYFERKPGVSVNWIEYLQEEAKRINSCPGRMALIRGNGNDEFGLIVNMPENYQVLGGKYIFKNGEWMKKDEEE